MYSENLKILENRLISSKGNFKHNINNNSPLLPFQTREPERPKFEDGFKRIIADFSRLISNKKLESDLTLDSVFNSIIKKNVVQDNNDEKYFKIILDEYLKGNTDNIKIIHPHMFLFIPETSSKESKGEYEIARFFRDVFFKDIQGFDFFINKKGANHLFLKLILDNLPDLTEDNVDIKYIPKLDYVVDMFKEDINFARKNTDFLIKNIDNIFAFYYFYYITQLSQKLYDKHVNEQYKFYYLLDFEKASVNRKSINFGYNIIKDANKNLLTKINTIEHVNTLLGTNGLTFSELNEHVESLNPKDKQDFINNLKTWINEYRKLNSITNTPLNNDFKKLFNYLYEAINEKIQGATKDRYALCCEEMAKKYFIKGRGRYGYVLNITQEMLLAITALSIKDDKIKLNKLFEEYESRGLYFDNESKEEIINLFNRLNLIDKKSDSGDAQYVKRIL